MANLTYAQKQRVARRTADITKLQQQYARAVEDYTASVGTKETAFKAEMDKYNAAYEPYQQKATAYQAKLSDYQKELATYQAAPTKTLSEFAFVGGMSGAANLPVGYYRPQNANSMQNYKIPDGYEAVGYNSATKTAAIVGKDVKNPGAFTEKLDAVAPIAPSALDIEVEKAKLQGEKDYTAREVDERTKARLRAVQRGNSRPMMSAGANLTKAA